MILRQRPTQSSRRSHVLSTTTAIAPETSAIAIYIRAKWAPIFFVTLCTRHREPWLADPLVQQGLINYAEVGLASGRAALGRYVIMPDHMHAFVRLSLEQSLGVWVKGIKAAMARAAGRTGRSWQPGFFDHVMRSAESYSEKWRYVSENPVRHGLTKCAESWPYAGEIASLDFR